MKSWLLDAATQAKVWTVSTAKVNSPWLAAYGVSIATAAEAWVRVAALLLGMLCTVAVTRHKLRK